MVGFVEGKVPLVEIISATQVLYVILQQKNKLLLYEEDFSILINDDGIVGNIRRRLSLPDV
jgi:hypothetical protein